MARKKAIKFLVLGASGMAGHMIAFYLKQEGHEVGCYCRKKLIGLDTITGNIEDQKGLEELIHSEKYDVIINAIGILNQYAETEKAKAVYINSFFPHFLSSLTENSKAKIIHMSTDCVFSGNTGNYTEYSLKDGETFYDRTKALGELVDGKNLTLRNSIIGPDMNETGIGLFNWFMAQENVINGYSHVMWNGLTTLELAKVMEQASYMDISGLHHIVPENSISKYDLLKLFNHYFKEDKIVINQSEELRKNKVLIRTNYDFDYKVPDYEKMLAELAGWIKSHKKIYPHYKLLF